MILIITVTGRRDVNKAFARVTGGKVNRGAGYGLEIPCVYQFYGPIAESLILTSYEKLLIL